MDRFKAHVGQSLPVRRRFTTKYDMGAEGDKEFFVLVGLDVAVQVVFPPARRREHTSDWCASRFPSKVDVVLNRKSTCVTLGGSVLPNQNGVPSAHVFRTAARHKMTSISEWL